MTICLRSGAAPLLCAILHNGTRMKKLPKVSREPNQEPSTPRQVPRRSSHEDLFFYAQSFHKAAKTLSASFQPDDNPFANFDVSAVVFMYRHALELHLKAIVLGEGGNFLATKPDPISVGKTHSISWLAQFVAQIVMALKWEQEFKCEGIETLADFKAAVESVASADPGLYVFRSPVTQNADGSFTVPEFSRKMDALLDLLESTADALAAEWDLRSDGAGVETGWNGGGFGPTIQ